MKSDSRATGQAGEKYAAEFLRRQGYRIVANNVRYRLGEIDLVADDHDTLVFVEVRARKPGRFGSAVDTLTRAKRARVVRAVELYLTTQNIPPSR
ncbi:MAG TPA: YraN family protein, partial [Chloroflexota bacterium]|nr:YraN family protein [Chloroflexota bacterium]